MQYTPTTHPIMVNNRVPLLLVFLMSIVYKKILLICQQL